MRRSVPRQPFAVVAALALCVSLTIGADTGAAARVQPVPGSGYVTDTGQVYGLDTPTGTLTRLGDLSRPLVALTLGTDGELYGIDDADQSLQKLDRTNGGETRQGPLLETSDPGRVFAALTTLPGGKIYASSYATGGPPFDGQLYAVARGTGAATPRGERQTDDALLSLAGSCDGTLFGANDRNELVKVSTATGVATQVGPLSPWPADAESVALAFDHRHGTLWALTHQGGDGAERLFKVDPGSGTLTEQAFVSGQLGSDPSTLALDSPAQCRYGRTVSLRHPAGTSRFEGVLRAPQRAACAANQRVRLLSQQPGSDPLVGSTFTDAKGRYRLRAPLHRGSYYAVVSRALGEDGVCLRTHSRVLSFVP